MPKAKEKEQDCPVSATNCIVTYPEALCRKQKSKTDNSVFRSVSLRFKEGTWGSFPLPEKAVRQAVRRNGEVIPNRLMLDLGDSEDVRFLSVRTDAGTYERKPFFNRTIKALIDNGKREYLRSIAQ